MNKSPNPWHEIQMQAREQQFSAQQHSYDLTQRLAYYVISAELVICGYMLLNADKLLGLFGASFLFCICGVTAFCGIAWRFFYNMGYHNSAHGIRTSYAVPLYWIQLVFHWVFVGLTLIVFLWVIISGCSYINHLDRTKVPAALTTQLTSETARPPTAVTVAKTVPALPTTAAKPGSSVKPQK